MAPTLHGLMANMLKKHKHHIKYKYFKNLAKLTTILHKPLYDLVSIDLRIFAVIDILGLLVVIEL